MLDGSLDITPGRHLSKKPTQGPQIDSITEKVGEGLSFGYGYGHWLWLFANDHGYSYGHWLWLANKN